MPSAQKVAKRTFSQTATAVSGQLGYSFDIKNPKAQEAARRNAARLVREVTQETKKALRDAVSRAYAEGIPPRDLARNIRSMIGLTSRQVNSVMNAQIKWMEGGLTATKAAEKATTYADKLLKSRALTIARTETIRASSEGQLAAWVQARDEGLIPPHARRQWLAAYDERTCPICSGLDGKLVTFEEPFEGDGGAIAMTPPAHPRCRCSTALSYKKGRQSRKAASVMSPKELEDYVNGGELVNPFATLQPYRPLPPRANPPAVVPRLPPKPLKIVATKKEFPKGRPRDFAAEYTKYAETELNRLKDVFGLDKLTVKRLTLLNTEAIEYNYWNQGVFVKSRASGTYDSGKKAIEMAIGGKRGVARVGISHDFVIVGHERWIVNESIEGVFRHEVGHAVQYQFAMRGRKLAEWQEIYNTNIVRLSRVSQYAATNHKELFAEAWSAWSHPNYRPQQLPSWIEDYLKKYFPKVKP